MQISVVIPTCHRNDLLARCLDRLAPGVQTLPAEEYEVIVTDDGCRSTAEAMIQEKYPWAKWTAGPKRGPAANRNHGAKMAVGEWIAFLDDDCIPTVSWLEGYAKAVLDGTDVYEGVTVCSAGCDGVWNSAPVNQTGGNFWSCNLMVSKTGFSKQHGFDDQFPHAAWEDVEFAIRFQRDGLKSTLVRSAIVDHPPAPVQRGRRYAPKWQGLLLVWHKHRKDYATPLHLIRHVAAVRFGELFRSTGWQARWMLFRAAVYETTYVIVFSWTWQHQLLRPE